MVGHLRAPYLPRRGRDGEGKSGLAIAGLGQFCAAHNGLAVASAWTGVQNDLGLLAS